MSVPIKATFFFEQVDAGWSDSFYIDYFPDLAAAKSYAAKLLAARYALCAGHVKCIGMRLSNPNVFRDSRFYSWQSLGSPPPTNYGIATDPGTAVLIRMEAGELVRRMFECRGIPGAIIDFVGTTLKDPLPNNWDTPLKVFYNCLVPKEEGLPKWGLWAENQTACPKTPATNIAPEPGALAMSFVCNNPITYVPPLPAVPSYAGPGDQVVLTQVKGTRGVNGTWSILSVTPTPTAITVGPYIYVMRAKQTPLAFANPHPIGMVRIVKKTVVGIDNLVTEGVDFRKVGRPFGQRRGRRRVTS